MEPWIVGSNPSERFPLWTRANVGEVFPDPVAPLSFTLLMREQVEGAWRDALAKMGAFTHDEFQPDEMETLGVFGGYRETSFGRPTSLGEPASGSALQGGATLGLRAGWSTTEYGALLELGLDVLANASGTETSGVLTYRALAVYHHDDTNDAPSGSIRYARLRAMITPNVPITRIVYAHRFHAVRNPRNLPSPTVAH